MKVLLTACCKRVPIPVWSEAKRDEYSNATRTGWRCPGCKKKSDLIEHEIRLDPQRHIHE